jgi:AGZA family xanthine/uracil permease-like MFS transporter
MGDINAFFALALDNVVTLVMLAGILAYGFGMPMDFVLTRMVPGTALGVLVGDLAYSWMAIRKGGGATAMPLGLDTPSTIGMAVAVIGPVFLLERDPVVAWQVGMATIVLMGLAKMILSFAGDVVTRILPAAALLGPIAGIGLALLGLFPVARIFSVPIAGIVAMGIVLYSLTAGLVMPFRLPGALVAVLIGAGLFALSVLVGWTPAHPSTEVLLGFHPPLPQIGHLLAGLPRAIDYLPISLPFCILTVIGGINVAASAREAGDDYRTRDILLVEAMATLVSGVFGGVAQTTPYIGHPAYKAMKARAGYTLATGMVIGVCGSLGLLGVLVDWLPEVAVAPILLFVGVEIAVQAFRVPPPRHLAAVVISIVPCLAYLVSIYTQQLMVAGAKPDPVLASQVGTIAILGRGFVLTSMLWGAATAWLIDRRALGVLLVFGVLSLFSLFGVIHSSDPSGALLLPWAAADSTPYQLALAYGTTGIILGLLIAFVPAPSERV